MLIHIDWPVTSLLAYTKKVQIKFRPVALLNLLAWAFILGIGAYRWLFTKPRTCTLVNFSGETKNVLDFLLFVIFL